MTRNILIQPFAQKISLQKSFKKVANLDVEIPIELTAKEKAGGSYQRARYRRQQAAIRAGKVFKEMRKSLPGFIRFGKEWVLQSIKQLDVSSLASLGFREKRLRSDQTQFENKRYEELYNEFTKEYDKYNKSKPRGIGVELELPIVSQKGETVSVSLVQDMFEFLEENGFKLERDNYSNYVISASRINHKSQEHFDYHIDTIMTEAGNSILEVVLAPQNDLHEIQDSLSKIMDLLVTYFDAQKCKILGYGIQPITPPSRKLLMPKERYFFYEKFSSNKIIPKSEGADAHLLTITASNQCHIDVGSKEAIPAINVLNAFSGLQIILHANSPIWNRQVDPEYKANREVFWEYCYPDRLNQMGIPPKFHDIRDYINYLLEFRPMLVKRKRLIQILDKSTFKEFLFSKTPSIGQALEGEKFIVYPEIEDIHYLNTFCYFNARLAPKIGTIESRMCCQQPPNAILAPTAVTLGIMANLEKAKKLMEEYPLETWKKIRSDALRYTFKTQLNGKSILPLVYKFLEVAKEGLLKRNLGEENFLNPLYQRFIRQKSPADDAIEILTKEGFINFLNYYSFTKTGSLTTESPLPKTQSQKK